MGTYCMEFSCLVIYFLFTFTCLFWGHYFTSPLSLSLNVDYLIKLSCNKFNIIRSERDTDKQVVWYLF